MSQDDEFSISELRRKREQSLAAPPPPPSEGHFRPQTHAGPAPQAQARPASQARAQAGAAPPDGNDLPVDPWRILGALKRQWYWPVIAAVVLGGLGLAAGLARARSEVTIMLVRPTDGTFSAGGVEGETFRLDQLSSSTLLSLLTSPELLKRGAKKASPPMEPGALFYALNILPQKETDSLLLRFKLHDRAALVDLANAYAAEVVAFTRELQVAEVDRMVITYRARLRQLDEDLKRANEDMVVFQGEHKIVDPALEAAAYTKQMVEFRVQTYTKQIELDQIEALIDFLSNEMPGQNQYAAQLAAANAKLVTLLARYTEQHHEVKAVRSEIAALEAQAAALTNSTRNVNSGSGSGSSGLQPRVVELRERQARLKSEITELDKSRVELQARVTGLSAIEIAYADVRGRVDSLRTSRMVLAKRLREVEIYLANARGYYKIFAPVTVDDVDSVVATKKATSIAVKGAMFGFLGVAILIILGDLRHQTIKTIGEVERITRLRMLATLGDLDKMTPTEQEKWAFRAWTVIAGQLNASANHGMVCGFMSSGHGEGRSTWIRLLGNAAGQRGLRVLTIATKPSGSTDPESEAETAVKEKTFGEAVEQAMTATQAEVVPGDDTAADDPSMAVLSASAFAFPAEVTKKFIAGEMPAAHIPLPGWVWNLDRRKQWQTALAHWRGIDNLVLLVELPPASVPESVLLAESLPQVIWLVDSGKARIRDTKEQLEMLRHAKCRIVGAVLNHEPDPLIKL